jgi:hypothetical protein
MIPTRDRLDTYFRHLLHNYDDLIKLFDAAKTDLNTILGATDKPVPKSDSLAAFIFETALGLTIPGVPLFMKASEIWKEAKSLIGKAQQLNGYVSKIDKAQDLVRKLNESSSQLDGAYHNGALKMMELTNRISDRLYKHKAMAIKQQDAFVLLLGKRDAAPAFEGIDWPKPPELVADHSSDVRYVFTYMLVRLAVHKYVKIKVYRWDPYNQGAGMRIVRFKPEGISEAGCNHIFTYFNRDIGGAGPWPGTPGTPSAHRIVRIRNYMDMIENWSPDVELIKSADYDDLKKDLDKEARDRRSVVKVTTEMIAVDGFRKLGGKYMTEAMRTTPGLVWN